MKKLLIAIFVFASIAFAKEQKYLIIFKDKGIYENFNLKQMDKNFLNSTLKLNDRAIARRIKSMGEDMIRWEDFPVYDAYIRDIENNGIKILRVLKWFNGVSAFLSENEISMLKKLDYVKKIKKIRQFIDRSAPINAASLPLSKLVFASDYGYSLDQAVLSEIPRVHQAGIKGTDVIIGVLDTGFDWQNHISLNTRNVINEYDFVFNDAITRDEANDTPGQHNHGTYCFSILGGYDPGNLIGPAYDAAFILAKTEDIRSEKHIEEDNYAAALEWMEAQGVDITSSSLGYTEFDAGQGSYTYADMDGETTIVTQAAELAFQRGVVTFSAAGNEGNSAWYYLSAPSDGFNTIGVGALSALGTRASFSGHGPSYDGRIKPDVSVLGVSVFGASTGAGIYTFQSGTSAATPIAAGIAGLLLSEYTHLSNYQVRKIFHESCDNSAVPDNERGYGLLSAKKALSFPNIQRIASDYRLNKIFFPDSAQQINGVTIHLSRNGSSFMPYTMIQKDSIRFFYDFSGFSSSDTLEFYFEISSNTGNFIEPGTNTYKLLYGNLNISLLTSFEKEKLIPKEITLDQNYPNPFNPGTLIRFYTPVSKSVQLGIFNSIGERIVTLFDGMSKSGYNHFYWDGKKQSGQSVVSGIYFYMLSTDDFVQTRKMILLH